MNRTIYVISQLGSSAYALTHLNGWALLEKNHVLTSKKELHIWSTPSFEKAIERRVQHDRLFPNDPTFVRKLKLETQWVVTEAYKMDESDHVPPKMVDELSRQYDVSPDSVREIIRASRRL